MKIARFEEIQAWQEARVLVQMVYEAVKSNGAFCKDYRLLNQIQSAAVSCMSNIAEGFSRRNNKEFVQFLFIAKSVYLFGSVAVGSSRRASDIDLYVPGLAEDQYWNFRHDLEEAVKLPIDLYTDGDDAGFIKKIMDRGEKIYGIQR